MSLGIIDWGIGGIGIYELIKRRQPDVPVVYFSDTGVTPYGRMTRTALIARLNSVARFLQTRGVTHLVVGCNAASTAIPYLELNRLKIEGVIASAVRTTIRRRPKRLGLIGGRRTVLSGVYRNAFDAEGIRVEQRIAQPLSALIESGDISSNRLHAECERILMPLRNCSHILLACTHYPAIASVLKKYVSGETEFIDPSTELSEKVSRWKVRSRGADVFLTSGTPADMKTAAQTAFGCEINVVDKVTLGSGSV